MKLKSVIVTFYLALMVGLAVIAAAKPGDKEAPPATTAAAPANSSAMQDTHLEGERRFRSNCGRCHAAPRKFSPRLMATIVRHMRVRATLTDEDMRLILAYMTE